MMKKERGPKYIIEWHIEVKMHVGRGNFCYSTLNLSCKTTARVGAKNLKGVSLGWAEQGQEWGRFEKKNL
jgi:hypothetical protein